MCSVAMRSTYDYGLRILGYLGRRATILTCSGPLKTPPAPAILPFPFIERCE